MPGLLRAQDIAESPSLQAQVDAGTLPPVADRLPENPLVITPLHRPGQQGGDWNHALVGGGSLSMLVRYQGYEPLMRFSPDWSEVIPNVAEGYEVNDEATVYTFTLRKGMKWSDGHPYTTEDIRFWYEDIMQNPDLEIPGHAWWSAGGERARLEIVDEQVFRVHFAAPNGFFVQQLAWSNQDHLTKTPAHYLKQFHIKYNPDADALATERGMANWVPLFQFEFGAHQDNVFFQNGNRPTLMAWMFTIPPGADTERALAVRNPYYFKVDTEGTQLPYFDRVVYQMVADPEVLLLKTLQGEIDMMDQYIGTPANRPVLFDGQEAGGYKFYTLKETAANVMVFQLNLNHLDPVRNALFNTRAFREAMSHAVDRQALIDTVFIGQGTPAQASIIEGDPLYNERLARQHTEYDPDAANALLDTLVPEKDAEGYRLDSEGRRLTIIFEVDQSRTTFLDMMELAIPMFQAVGRRRADAHDGPLALGGAGAQRPRVRRDGAPVRRQQRHRRHARRPLLRAAQLQLALRAGLATLLHQPRQPQRHRAAGGDQGPAGALPQAARHRRSGAAAGGDGRGARERRRPVPGLRRHPAVWTGSGSCATTWSTCPT